MSAAGLSIRVPATTEHLARVRADLADCARASGMSTQGVDDAKTVVTEACGNAIRHAYDAGPVGPLEVMVGAEDGELRIVVRDFGDGFRPGAGHGPPGLHAGLAIIGALTSDFRLETRRGGGTKIEARLPLVTEPSD